MNYLVLDTNILLLDHLNITTLGSDGSTIVLPSTVIQETDSKKSVPGELGYQARSFGRMIARGTIHDPILVEDLVITPVTLDCGTSVHITSTNTYPDFTDLDPSIINDRKIIEIALQYHNIYSKTTFISNDVMARISATALGLHSIDLKVTEDTTYNFIKFLSIEDPEIFRTLHNSPIAEIDPSYTPENYSYRFESTTTGQVKLATVVRGVISIIGKETEKELRQQDAPPINSEQLLLSSAIHEPTNDIIICDAKSGSGKTVTAISNAIKLVKKGRFNSILYIRNTIDDVSTSEEEIGFLSTNEAKEAVYLHALHDTLDFIVRRKFSNSKAKGEELEKKIEEGIVKLTTECDIQAMIPLGMRGRTFTDSVIIIDEVQNMPSATLQKILTRVGKGSKVILIGSQNQIDSSYLTRFNNGLAVLLDAATKPSNIQLFATSLHKVARSPICEFAETLFEKKLQ